MSRTLRVAVQMDPIHAIDPNADSTFALMLEAQARGHALWVYDVRAMSLREGKAGPDARRVERLTARARPARVTRVAPGERTGHAELEPEELLDLVAGLGCAVAPTEIDGKIVLAVDVDSAEVASCGKGVGAWGAVAVAELDAQTSVRQRAAFEALPRPTL